MMSQVIRQETIAFLCSVLHGAQLTFFYDVLRSFRRGIPHGIAAVSVEDFLFWLTAGFLTFQLLFFQTAGVMRGYVAAGIALGAFLCHALFGHMVLKIGSRMFSRLRSMVRFLAGLAGTFVRTVFCLPLIFLRKQALKHLRRCGGRLLFLRKRRRETQKKRQSRKKKIEFRRRKSYNQKKHLRTGGTGGFHGRKKKA